MTPAIEQLINSFASNLYQLVCAEMRAEVATVLGDGLDEASGTPVVPPIRLTAMARVARQPHKRFAAVPVPLKAPRKKGPIQLCPAPGCRERAAPSLRMLCKKHAGTPKTTVAKWREARRAKVKKAA